MSINSTSSTLDVQSIVSQLMAVQRQPLKAITSKIDGMDTKISAMGQIKSALSALRTAAQALDNVDTWRASTATSSDDKTVKATLSGTPPAGSYSVKVDRLAQAQTATSGKFDSSDAVVGGGTLTIQLGTWDESGKTFTADTKRSAVTVTVPAKATLAQVRDAINAASPGVGATLLNDGGKVRLMLRGSEGAANAFSITAKDDDGNNSDASGLSQLTVDPAGGGNTPLTQSAVDAKFNIGGLDMTASSNTVTNAVDGLTLTLGQTSTTPVSIKITSDGDAMRKKVDAFVSAYNDAVKVISDLTKYDADTKQAATLQGNSTIEGLRTKLVSMVTGSIGSGALSSLSNAGITLQRDGSLKVDDTKFKAAVTNPGDLATLFSNTDDKDSSKVGIARRIDTFITQILGSDGSMTNSVSALQASKKRLNDQSDSMSRDLDLTEKRLLQLYSSLDKNLSQIASASNYLSQLTNSSNN